MSFSVCTHYFNSQPHEEADIGGFLQRISEEIISTHSLTKRLTTQKAHCRTEMLFQLTASRRGWRLPVIPNRFSVGYFNSQPHEEADRTTSAHGITVKISTHSLTKRLTAVTVPIFPFSIFQLTASRRGWRYSYQEKAERNIISTHSLTKRLTKKNINHFQNRCISTHSLTKRLTLIAVQVQRRL